MSADPISPWPLGGPEVSGVPLIAVHVASLLAAGLIVLTAESLGRSLIDLLTGVRANRGGESDAGKGTGQSRSGPVGRERAGTGAARMDGGGWDAVDEVTGALLVGLGVIGTMLLALSAVGISSRTGVVALALMLIAARARRLPGSALRIAGAVRAPILALPGRGVRILGAGCVAAVAVLALPRALLPAVDWDSLMYHLPIPLAVLEAGRMVIPDDNLHAAYAGLPHLLHTPFLSVGVPAAIQLLGLALAAALGLSVWSAAGRRGGVAAASGALVALLGSTPVLLVAVTPRVDVTLAAWMWIGHAALLRLALDGWSRRVAVTATLVLGFGIGVKYHAFAYGAAVVPLALVACFRGADPATGFRRLTAMALGALACGAPWLMKNAVLFGAPLYPFGAERIVPPWLAELLGSPLHPESVARDVYWILREARAPFDPLTFLTDPARVSVEGEAAFFLMSPLLLLAIAGMLGARRRNGGIDPLAGLATVGPAIGFGVLILGVSTRTNPRYLLPVLPGLAVAAGWGVSELLRRLPAARRSAMAVALAALGLMPLGRVAATALDPVPPLRHAVGLDTPAETIRARGGGALLLLAERLSGETGRALLIAEARGLLLGERVLQDNVLTNWPLLTALDPSESCLSGSGIGVVVIGRGTLDFYRARGMDLDPLRLGELESFLDRCGTGRERLGPYEVVSLGR